MNKIFTLLILASCVCLLQSGIHGLNFSSQPPTGYTGATGNYCNTCHSGNPLNAVGGSVTVSGLPSGGYVPFTQYPISLTINHGASNRQRWGFSMKAVNSSGTSVGTFSSTNSNAATNGTELSHNNAVSTSSSNSFTYNNLRWTAPAASGNVTFFYVGNAADGSGDGGDFIYAGSSVVALPIELGEFYAINDNNNILLKWQTLTEVNSNYFDIERSDDGQFFFSIGRVDAIGNSSRETAYSFLDTKLSYNNGSQIFYRLKLVDKDGSAKYSNHISIKPVFNGITIKNIYPTIIKKSDPINVDIASDKSRVINIIVLDASGRNLQVINSNLSVGNNRITFSPKINDFKGMLFVKFVTDNFQQTKSLILQ
ncbi:MAG: hypothetical protein KGZ59_12125 [Chitinophagaceae bacterium]|nr:hypothetical protein [Chitinophagaceae bacterium]